MLIDGNIIPLNIRLDIGLTYGGGSSPLGAMKFRADTFGSSLYLQTSDNYSSGVNKTGIKVNHKGHVLKPNHPSV